MGAYVIRRILQIIPVVIGTTFLIYLMVWGLQSDPFVGRCGERACPEAYVQMMRDKYNLDDPLLISYAKYFLNLITGDFGTTFSGIDVTDQIKNRFPTTFRLTIIAIVFEALIGIAAGVWAGLRRGKFIDSLVLVSTLVVISIPVFVIGRVLQLYLGMQWQLFPATASPEGKWSELILPGFVLGSASIAYVARLVRNSIAENMRADYVRAATAKGLTQTRVVGVHVLRNSMLPVVTFLGTDFGALLGGAIVTEGIFNVSGLGGMVFGALNGREGQTVTSVVALFVLVYLLVNLAVDILYAWLDPRIRYE